MTGQPSPADLDDGPGDPFERFVRSTAEGAARRLRNACQQSGIDVQDLLQDTYIKALQAWQKTLAGLTADQQQTWVATTAGRLLIDCMRSPDYRRRKDIDTPDIADAQAAPDEQIYARDRLRRVCNLIHKLRPREQEVVIMYSLCGHDYNTIARELGTSVGAVTTTMSRARAQLAKMVNEEGLE